MSASYEKSSHRSEQSNGNITTISEFRNAALQQLKNIMSGDYDLDQVRAFCQMSNTVIGTLNVEISYLKSLQQSSNNKIPFITDSKLIEHE